MTKPEAPIRFDLNKIRQLTWNQLYRNPGVKPPAGIDTVYMRLLTMAPDHDATYGKT